jgi:hypothetical protein
LGLAGRRHHARTFGIRLWASQFGIALKVEKKKMPLRAG